jgi:structural maintenance of chromosome 3 (chondroitin sulfate proteoglycan 6)
MSSFLHCDPTYKRLQSLFHVVVDNDATASKVLEVMIKEKTGRVTFMPLNRLKPKNPPPPNAQDAIPLIDKLRYEPIHQKAFQQVFGKTCVCRDLTIAAAYVKSHGINTITLDGDKVDRKGALTGGYHDVRRSRIEAIKNVTTWKAKFDTEEKRVTEVKATSLEIDQKVTRVQGRLQVTNSLQEQARTSRQTLLDEANALTREGDRLKERIIRLEGDVDDMETELGGLQAKLASYNNELASPMSKSLTDEEEMMIDTLGKEVETRQKQVIELGKARVEVSCSHYLTVIRDSSLSLCQLDSRKNSLEIELNESLRRRRREIQAKIETLGETENGESSAADGLDSRVRELKSLNSSIQTLTKKSQGEIVWSVFKVDSS